MDKTDVVQAYGFTHPFCKTKMLIEFFLLLNGNLICGGTCPKCNIEVYHDLGAYWLELSEAERTGRKPN